MKAKLLGLALLGSTLFAADFFPLQPGNTWVYREPRTGSTFTVSVSVPFLINNRVYHRVSGYATEPLLVRKDDEGQLLYRDEERNQDLILSSLVPFEGGWWYAPFRQCEQEAQTLTKRGVFDGAAGPIQDVLEVRYRSYGCGDAGTNSEQYAENIGMVRRTVSTIAGPRQYDLVYARVGQLNVEALPYGRFTVNATWAPSSSIINATLRLQTNASVPVKLVFPTGQEYDLLLKDEQGKVVWRWSDGQFFTQAFHNREVSREWSVNVQIPRPPSTGQLPQKYTLEAWLTTETPQFAASVPFTITAN